MPGWLIQRGWSIDRARKSVMFAASCIIPACFVAVTRVPSPAWAVALISIAMFCHASWANMTLPAELFPRQSVGSVSGFGGAMGSLVGAITMLIIGRTVSVSSFTPIFIVYAALPITAWAMVCILARDLGRIRDVALDEG